mgnify:CR=1 FL=1
MDAWKSWFPEDVKWYQFQAVEDKAEGYQAVALRHSYVIETGVEDIHGRFAAAETLHMSICG